MISGYKDFQQYKRLLGVLCKFGIDTIDTAHLYNDWYLIQKRMI